MNKRIIVCALFALALLLMPGTSPARWMNPNSGRFHTMDTFEGRQEDPQSLHKYVYAENNPVNNIDPSGQESIGAMLAVLDIQGMFAQVSNPVAPRAQQRARQVASNRPSSKKIWEAYAKINYVAIPDVQHEKVWELIGGNVGAQYGPANENTCAARVSYGLNYGGAPIPSVPNASNMNFADKVYKGKKGDNKRYIVRAADMNAYLTKAWGVPDFPLVGTVPALNTIVSGLQTEQVAVFSTRQTPGHAGALKKGYQDPYVNGQLPVDVWKLIVP